MCIRRFLRLLQEIQNFIDLLPDSDHDESPISYSTRLLLFNVYYFLMNQLGDRFDDEETAELTQSFTNLLLRVHAKFGTQQQGPLLNYPNN